jgi:hypothetical protein
MNLQVHTPLHFKWDRRHFSASVWPGKSPVTMASSIEWLPEPSHESWSCNSWSAWIYRACTPCMSQTIQIFTYWIFLVHRRTGILEGHPKNYLPSPLLVWRLHPHPPNPKNWSQMLRVQMKWLPHGTLIWASANTISLLGNVNAPSPLALPMQQSQGQLKRDYGELTVSTNLWSLLIRHSFHRNWGVDEKGWGTSRIQLLCSNIEVTLSGLVTQFTRSAGDGIQLPLFNYHSSW